MRRSWGDAACVSRLVVSGDPVLTALGDMAASHPAPLPSCSSPPLGGEARRGGFETRATPSPNLSPYRGRGV
jgi:hypothetical protein